jgi:hypothetical protein
VQLSVTHLSQQLSAEKSLAGWRTARVSVGELLG